MAGPLAGLRVIELAARLSAPFAAMLFADMGADVLRIDRIAQTRGKDDTVDPIQRGRRSVALDVRRPEGVATILTLVEQADVFIEGMRPGAAERLGIGPDVCLEHNARLVYGRFSGNGQDGPLARMPGHVINYIALSGALEAIGRAGENPVVPLDLVGGTGAGMGGAFGVLCAVFEARRSGRGQVVDAAAVDDAALLTTALHASLAGGSWNPERGTNIIDTGAPFYNVYETADRRYVAVGAAEPQFYQNLLDGLGLSDDPSLPEQMDRASWPRAKEIFGRVFRTRTLDEWCAIFDGKEACVTPVLTRAEAPLHPHVRARETFVVQQGVVQPAPAPRFSRTPAPPPGPAPRAGEHTDDALEAWGIAPATIAALRTSGAIG